MSSPQVTESRILSTHNERILVSCAKAGNHEAFIELCESSSRHAFNAIYRILKNREDSDDVLQETLLRAFLHINEFHGDSSFATWLTRIGINSALMFIRRRRFRHVSIDQPNERAESSHEWVKTDPSLSPEQQVLEGEAVWRLHTAISRLPRTVRSVVEICHMREEPLKETAASLGISLPAAKSRLFRAKRMLNRSLAY